MNECSKAEEWVENNPKMQNGESITKIRARRGVYVNKDLKPGHQIQEDDLLYVRPSTNFTCSRS